MATRDQIVRGAYLECRAFHPGHTPTAEEVSDAAETLNRMILEVQVAGVDVLRWTRQEVSVTLADATAAYTVGPTGGVVMSRPRAVFAGRFGSTPLLPMSTKEYNALPSKTTAGDPQFFVPDMQVPNARVYFYPVKAVASGATVTLEVERQVSLFDAADDEQDFPPEWENALVKGLAVRLANGLGVPAPRLEALRVEAQGAFNALGYGTS